VSGDGPFPAPPLGEHEAVALAVRACACFEQRIGKPLAIRDGPPW